MDIFAKFITKFRRGLNFFLKEKTLLTWSPLVVVVAFPCQCRGLTFKVCKATSQHVLIVKSIS